MSVHIHPNLPMEVCGKTGLPLGMPAAHFLRDYWQKQPLLIRSALPDFHLPLQPDDLAGLACEESVLARLIQHHAGTNQWQVRHGPFNDSDFAALPAHDWTLLVQDVDKWDMDVAALLESFSFLPSWRLDDIMVSYAEAGGSVGPHVDQYDVFLLQSLGRKHWSINIDPCARHECLDDLELKVLREFTASHEWMLEPGDMLYLPPGIAHLGVSVAAGMTFSIGMRAPAVSELLLDYVEHIAMDMPDSLRYRDTEPVPAEHPGEITPAALAEVATTLGPVAQHMNQAALADWFGCFITRYRSNQLAAAPQQLSNDTELLRALEHGAMLLRHPWSRLAWVCNAGKTTLFSNGEAHDCPLDLAKNLCRQRYLDFQTPPEHAERMALLQLINTGHLVISDDGAQADG